MGRGNIAPGEALRAGGRKAQELPSPARGGRTQGRRPGSAVPLRGLRGGWPPDPRLPERRRGLYSFASFGGSKRGRLARGSLHAPRQPRDLIPALCRAIMLSERAATMRKPSSAGIEALRSITRGQPPDPDRCPLPTEWVKAALGPSVGGWPRQQPRVLLPHPGFCASDHPLSGCAEMLTPKTQGRARVLRVDVVSASAGRDHAEACFASERSCSAPQRGQRTWGRE